MNKTILRNKYFLTALLLFIAGAVCFALAKTGGTCGRQEGDFDVVTSFYPMYIATLNLTEGIEGVTVTNLTGNIAGCPHDYQLSTKDLKLLDGADMLVINGGGMEDFLADAIGQFPDLDIATACDGIDLVENGMYDESGGLSLEGEEHDHGEYNAHAWLSISLYIQQLENIADALAQKDFGHADFYMENLRRYKERLMPLKEQAERINLRMITDSGGISGQGAVLFSEAFVYLQRVCPFKIAAVVDMDENTGLSASRIGEIIDLVNNGTRVNFLITDELYGKDTALAVAAECDAKIIYMDTMVSGENDKNSYIDAMQKNLDALEEAFLRE